LYEALFADYCSSYHVLVPTLNLDVNITIEVFMYLLSDFPSEVANIRRVWALARRQYVQ
jgi:hypothetical protein